MLTHIAVIARKAKGYQATFPDFPGHEVEGATLEEVRIQAQGALEEYLATNFEEGKTAKAKSLDEVALKAEGGILLALSVNEPKSRAVRINITIPEDLLAAVDRAAEAHDMSRSRFLAKAVEAMVAGRRHGGIQVPLSEEALAAVDKAAEAHHMDRPRFLSGLIEVAVGLRKGHGEDHRKTCGHGSK
ncbi:MAG TPA: type II toxin-antitoxin system HicB family antitoxin [Holophaga sp.]|nr:type II toxin-antitoxin system HicB family antitoxin [Holophaga sp.]